MESFIPAFLRRRFLAPTVSSPNILGTGIPEDEFQDLIDKSRNVQKAIDEAVVASLGQTEKILQSYQKVSNPDIKDFGAGVSALLEKVDQFCDHSKVIRRHREWTDMQTTGMMVVGVMLFVAYVGVGAVCYYYP